jgi:hypothetical protein
MFRSLSERFTLRMRHSPALIAADCRPSAATSSRSCERGEERVAARAGEGAANRGELVDAILVGLPRRAPSKPGSEDPYLKVAERAFWISGTAVPNMPGRVTGCSLRPRE